MKLHLIITGNRISFFAQQLMENLRTLNSRVVVAHLINDGLDPDMDQEAFINQSGIQTTVTQTQDQRGKAKNIFDYVKSYPFDPKDIIGILDSDDLLLKSNIDEIVMPHYRDGWDIVWTNYRTSTGNKGHCRHLSPFFTHRIQGWQSSHFFTFRRRLFDDFEERFIFNQAGEPVRSACDIAIALPLLDQTIKRRHVEVEAYQYTVDNPQSHHNRGQQNNENQRRNAVWLYSNQYLSNQDYDFEDFLKHNIDYFIKAHQAVSGTRFEKIAGPKAR